MTTRMKPKTPAQQAEANKLCAALSKAPKATKKEIAAQAKSWARQDKD